MSSCTERRVYAYKSDDTSCVYGAGYKFGTDGKHVTKGAAATDKIIGICQTEAGQVTAAEDPLELALRGGGAKALLNGVVTRGAELAFNGTGFVAASSADWVSAIAMESGVSGDIIPVEVCGNFKP